MDTFNTWVRAQDDYGQFDVIKGSDLRDGVTLVDGYPEHYGQLARPGKAKIDLRVESTEGYSSWRKPELLAEIDRRNTEATDAGLDPVIAVTKGDKVADLKALLELHDETVAADADAAAAAAQTPDAQPSDTGSNDNNNETGAPGQESE